MELVDLLALIHIQILIIVMRLFVSPSIQNYFVSQNSRHFYKFLNQYQVYLYLFECISHGDSKYSYLSPECLHFLNFCDIFNLLSAHACHVESINP